MIKGINRQIIELSQTPSTYYEKAWLIVKPEYANLHEHLLEKEAKKLLKELDAPSSMKTKHNLGFWAWRLGLSALSGAAVTLILHSVFV